MNLYKTFSLVLVFTLGYRILGFLREIVIANQFGVGLDTDAFFMAQAIPNLILEIFALGSLSATIIPLFRTKREDITYIRQEMGVLTGNFLFLGIGLLAVLYMSSSFIIDVLVPGFSAVGQEKTESFLRISILALPLLVITELYCSVINCYDHTEKISFSHCIYNFIIVAFGVIFGQFYGIAGFVYATLLAAIVRCIYIYIKVRGILGSIRVHLSFRNKNFQKILFLLYPIMLSSIAIQINFIVDRMISSTLEEGSITYLVYANKMVNLPLGIILGAVILTTFPLLVELLETKKVQEYNAFFRKNIEMILLLMGILAVVVFVFAEYIIAILFQYGSFTLEQTMRCGEVLRWYSFSIVGISFVTLFQKIFYAVKETKIPAIVSIGGVILNISLNILMAKIYGVIGIAMATTLSNLLTGFVLYLLLRRHKAIHLQIPYGNALKLILLNAVFLLEGLVIREHTLFILQMDTFMKITSVVLLGMTFLLQYAVAIYLFYPYRELLRKGGQ